MDESTSGKVCCRCGVEKAISDFYKRAVSHDGLTHACKPCLAESRRRRREMSSEDRAAEVAALVNRVTKICTACGQEKARSEFRSKPRNRSRDGLTPKCLACESEWNKQNYEANREKRLQQCYEWYTANRERKNATGRAYHATHSEHLAERRRAWLAKNPGYMAEFMRKRRTVLAGGDVTDVQLEELWTGGCAICFEPLDPSLSFPDPMSKSVDHIIPISRGGAHTQVNLQWTHLICNIRKGAKILT